LAAKGSTGLWRESGLGATSARLPVEASANNRNQMHGSQNGTRTPVSERDLMRAGDNLREWKESARRPSSPLEVPKRIGSVGSGGVDGYGFIRADLKVNPVKIDQPAGNPALLDPSYRLMSPGRPWWERERFQVKHLAETPRTKRRPPSPVHVGVRGRLGHRWRCGVVWPICSWYMGALKIETNSETWLGCALFGCWQVPFGAALNKAVLQNDSRLSVTDDFQANRKVCVLFEFPRCDLPSLSHRLSPVDPCAFSPCFSLSHFLLSFFHSVDMFAVSSLLFFSPNPNRT
jgi:hypothetical protein